MIDIQPFIDKTSQQLAEYVAGVINFTASLGQDKYLEKSNLRSKKPDEYIRNILAISILSHLQRPLFLETAQRIIVLPDCLKNYSDHECCKEDKGNESVCTQCHPDCLVNEIMDRYADDNTSIVLEPEELDKYFERINKNNDTVGVVGSACALTLLSGFHATMKYKYPTQGVILNYSSCKHHWSVEGENTSLSFRRLNWVMGGNRDDDPDPPNGRGPTYSMEKPPLSPDDFYRITDYLCLEFESEYLPLFKNAHPGYDLFELSKEVSKAIVPDLISRDAS